MRFGRREGGRVAGLGSEDHEVEVGKRTEDGLRGCSLIEQIKSRKDHLLASNMSCAVER